MLTKRGPTDPTDQRTNRLMDGWMDGQTDQLTDQPTDGDRASYRDERMHLKMLIRSKLPSPLILYFHLLVTDQPTEFIETFVTSLRC